MKRFSIVFQSLIVATLAVFGAEPSNYYQSCEGKSGKTLLQALHSVIGSHTNVGYDGLWTVYQTSDVRANGTVWDMYSTKEWVVGKERCGNYKNVGDCINREHSFPKSWFNDASPMMSDAFHIYPTDGKVNGQRSNFPYGECSGGTTLASNGNVKALGRFGTSTFPGYNGKVFEPDDQYKGDFARSYFYMAACYNDRIANWNSDMLAKNNYPAFSSWALNLLLKWHRQDPVSKKETDRNDAVYKHQKNRNPFIDHPELVEYIWGDKQGQGWAPGGEVDPVLTSPVNGATIDVGVTGLGIERSVTVPVKGTGLTEAVSVSVSGAGFSVSAMTLSADMVNNGRAAVSVRYVSATEANGSGVLTLTSGKAKVAVALTARAVSGLPATSATDISEDSFVAHWCNVDGDGAMYSFMLYLNGVAVEGYPVNVPAEDEMYLVTGLEPGAHYSYTLSYDGETSNVIEVTTATPIPSIQFLFDGELDFVTAPGEPSEVAELLLDIENIAGDIELSVAKPFELSVDKAQWSQKVTLAEGEERVYMRLGAAAEGSYMTDIVARAGDYVNDDVEVRGLVASESSLFEDFESGNKAAAYTDGTYQGNTMLWNIVNVAIDERDRAKAYDGAWVCCFGTKAEGSIATASPLAGGIGTVSFMANLWPKDADAKINVEYSTDGSNWTAAGSVTVTGDSYNKYTVTVNKPGALYLRLHKTAGRRVLIDNIEASGYSGVGSVAELYYHSWDAYCRGGELVIENSHDGDEFQVYGIDGVTRFDGRLGAGETSIKLDRGLYIVVSGDFARRVLVK
ncbi:MAG: endonuclease [Muribaculaceae bacterium]|nr:endonuclease [Muribaculaceae bacterium]